MDSKRSQRSQEPPAVPACGPAQNSQKVTASKCEKWGKSWRNIATALTHSTRLSEKTDSKDNVTSLEDFVGCHRHALFNLILLWG